MPPTRRLARSLLVIALALPCGAGTTQDRPRSESPDAAELAKLATAFDFVRARNARDYTVSGPNAIDEGRFVELGGIPQWITIRSEDSKNPVLLVLHGGPGDATNPWGYAVLRPWFKVFTVVQWDQRGAGRTLAKSGTGSATTLTLEQLTRDGIELAELLRTTLGKEKIVLLGHSFGSILGVLMAKARPELFYAFVGTGQVADPQRGYTVAHQELLAKARSVDNRRALVELQEIGPPPYADGRGFAIQRKWSNLFERADVFLMSTFALALTAPNASVRDTNDWLEGQSVSAGSLVPQVTKLQASSLAGDFSLPVFVIQGAEDHTTPTSLARAFVTTIRAPRKAFATIAGGHFAAFMSADAFLEELTSRVLPIAR